MPIARRAVVSSWIALITACHPGTGRPDGDGAQLDEGECPAAQPSEERCWGPGDGCGPAVTPVMREACGPLPACDPGAPIEGLVWPAPIRTRFCERGFGHPFCAGSRCTDTSVCTCHCGLDLALWPGAPVHAIYDGMVVHVSEDPSQGVGNVVVVRHDIPGVGVVHGIYWHLVDLQKKLNEPVTLGDSLGKLVQFACGPQMFLKAGTHFHLAIWRGELTAGMDLDNLTTPALPPPGDVCRPVPDPGLRWPAQFVDPLCLLRGAPLAPGVCGE